jgi:hypothetical protein
MIRVQRATEANDDDEITFPSPRHVVLVSNPPQSRPDTIRRGEGKGDFPAPSVYGVAEAAAVAEKGDDTNAAMASDKIDKVAHVCDAECYSLTFRCPRPQIKRNLDWYGDVALGPEDKGKTWSGVVFTVIFYFLVAYLVSLKAAKLHRTYYSGAVVFRPAPSNVERNADLVDWSEAVRRAASAAQHRHAQRAQCTALRPASRALRVSCPACSEMRLVAGSASRQPVCHRVADFHAPLR